MKLFLVRHTETNSPTGICYGQMDVGVLPSFPKEMAMIREKLQNISFAKIYSSPSRRCSILAESVKNGSNKVIYDERLREINFGSWEGMYWNEIEKLAEAKPWFADYLNTPCTDGESYMDLLQRVQRFIDDLATVFTGENVMIICHSGTIRAFYSIIKNISPKDTFDLKIDYGQVIELDFNTCKI